LCQSHFPDYRELDTGVHGNGEAPVAEAAVQAEHLPEEFCF